MGGSDQWGNIVTGNELIRRKGEGEAYALTTQLIKKSDGTKFGKSEGGNVWLDANRTSPYKFYQFWLNASDEDAANYIKIFTLKTKSEIDALIAEHAQAPHLRLLQKALADDITTRVHSAQALERAQMTSNILFGSSIEDFKQLTADEVLAAFDETDIFEIDKAKLLEVDMPTLLAESSTIFASKGEAKKSLQANAVSINKAKVNLDKKIQAEELLFDNLLLVQKGKKNYYLFKTI
jgi:tyrosyl-tRNA synthetase